MVYEHEELQRLHAAREVYVAALNATRFGILGRAAVREAAGEYARIGSDWVSQKPDESYQRAHEENQRFVIQRRNTLDAGYVSLEPLLLTNRKDRRDTYQSHPRTVADKARKVGNRLDIMQAKTRRKLGAVMLATQRFGVKKPDWQREYDERYSANFSINVAQAKAAQLPVHERIAQSIKVRRGLGKFAATAAAAAIGAGIFAAAFSGEESGDREKESARTGDQAAQTVGISQSALERNSEDADAALKTSKDLIKATSSSVVSREVTTNEDQPTASSWQPVTGVPEGYWAEYNETEESYKAYASTQFNSIWQIAEQTIAQHTGAAPSVDAIVHVTDWIASERENQNLSLELNKYDTVHVPVSVIDQATA